MKRAVKLHSDWLVPDWPGPQQVNAFCTTRAGGTSLAPFDSLNLGLHVGDRPEAVLANRSSLQDAMAARPVFLSQVHGSQVLYLDTRLEHDMQADGSLTDQSGVACCVMVADCLPVLLSNQQGTRVGAAHAGWRGLAGQSGRGILESVHERLSDPDPLVWLGPCIGPQAFEVGDEVRDIFVEHAAAADLMFKRKGAGKWLADLPGLARLRLKAMGVSRIYGNDGSAKWCTVTNSSRFFSHRRDRISGRMAACIWLA
jgi:YfiH family protein